MSRSNSTIRTAVSLLLVSELLLAQLAISSPQLHQWLHCVDSATNSRHDHCASHHEDSEDAQQANHVCAIFLVAEGILNEEGAIEIHPSNALKESVPTSDSRLAGIPSMAWPSARGPPHRFR